MLNTIKVNFKKYHAFILISLATFILISLSFYIRLHINTFIQATGFVVGEIWVFYDRYSNHQIYNFFYPIEYPVGFVLIHKVVLLINQLFFPSLTYPNFVLSHAVIMVPLAIVFILTTYHLSELVKTNKNIILLYLFLSPTFFITSTTNYDLFTSFFTILAVFLLMKNKLYLSFLCLSLGTIIKLYPVFLVPLFVIFAYSKRFKALQIAKACCIYLAIIIFINLPFMLYNFQYWLTPYRYQIYDNPQRLDPNTISYYLGGHLRIAFFILSIFISWIVAYSFYRHKIFTDKNFMLLLYFCVFTIVFANQVNVPQYFLWFLPFAAIVQLPVLVFWIPFDLVNSLRMFFESSLNNFPQTKLLIFNLTILNFTFMYLFLICKIRNVLKQANQ